MLGNTKYITLEGAKRMMAAAEAEAKKNNWNVAVAILDAGGHLLMFQKLDGTQPGSSPHTETAGKPDAPGKSGDPPGVGNARKEAGTQPGEVGKGPAPGKKDAKDPKADKPEPKPAAPSSSSRWPAPPRGRSPVPSARQPAAFRPGKRAPNRPACAKSKP